MGCSKNHLKEWMFFDACANWAHNKREYSDTINKSISASLSKIFKYGRSFNEGSFIAKRDISSSLHQMQGTFALNSLLPNGLKTNFDITSGKPVKDLVSLKYSVGMTINGLVRKKPITVSFRQTFYDGGKFLGIDRADTSQQLSVSYPFSNGFNVSIGYAKTVSTIHSFSSAGPIFSISLPVISHVALVPVKLFLDRYGPDALFKDMVEKARCGRCGSKNILRTQIIYVGNSALAS